MKAERKRKQALPEVVKRDALEYVIAVAERMMKEGQALPGPSLPESVTEKAYRSAVNSTRPIVEIPMTPIMKHMLLESGDLKPEERLKAQDEETKAEAWLSKVCSDFIKAHGGTGKYDESQSVFSVAHYWVDCLDNIPKNWRHTWPKPKETLEEVVDVYREPFPKPKLSYNDMLRTDEGRVGFDFMNHCLPRVAPETEFKLTAQPFESRDSSVGVPFVQNARTVDPDTGKTYGKLSVELAEKTPLKELHKYNFYVQHVRPQRGTLRMVWGSSAVVNSSLNRQARREIDAYKAVPGFIGYNNVQVLRSGMSAMGHFCEAHGFKCRNNDQARYDRHIAPQAKSHAEAIRYFKAATSLGKQIAFARGCMSMQGYVMTREGKKWIKVYPRFFSGELDTNSDEGIISGETNIYSLQKQDPEYKVKILYACPYVIFWMGDDILFVYDPAHYDQDTHVEIMAELGLDVHREKGEFGLFFLQWRLCEVDGHEIMVRPFTRTLRSLLFKERPVGLGPYGWLVSTWQQFEGLIEFPEVLDFVVSIIYPFDSLHLGVDVTIDKVKEQIALEDQEAAEKSGSQARSTADRLFDGDPQKSTLFEEADGKLEINFSSDYLSRIQRAIIDSVNRVKPSLTKLRTQLGFPSP